MKTEQSTEAKIKNFTPLLDELVQKYGVITAAVWGRVWRYAQQENHVCQASHEKIATELSISSRTVIRHLQILVEGGYLFDHTPGLKNIPHTYSITQKARILVTVEGVTESHTNKPEGVTESQTGVTESPQGCDRKSHEETIKETNNSLSLSETEGGKTFVGILAGSYSALGRRAPQKFKTKEMRDKWLSEVESRLSIAEIEDATRKALQMGITDLPRLVAYISKWNTQPKPTYNNGGAKNAGTARRPVARQDENGGMNL